MLEYADIVLEAQKKIAPINAWGLFFINEYAVDPVLNAVTG